MEPIKCPACLHSLEPKFTIVLKPRSLGPSTMIRDTLIDHWYCPHCGVQWSVDQIQEHIERTEHPLKDVCCG